MDAMIRKAQVISSLIALAVLIGCTGTLEPTPAGSNVGVIPTTASPLTTDDNAAVRRQCPSILMEIQSSLIAEGQLVLDSNDLLMLDFHGQKVKTISGLGISTLDARVSPDGKWLVFSRDVYDESMKKVLEKRLSVMGIDGAIQKEMLWESGWEYIAGWLDNEHVIITGKLAAGAVVLVNPFSGQKETRSPTFPAVYDEYPPRWYVAVYNPSLSHVVYLRQPMNGKFGVVLWALQPKRAVWEFNSRWLSSTPPEWSPDGSQFAVVKTTDPEKELHEELFLVNQEGEEIQLTDLSIYQHTVISGISWSPDGQRIAFWLNSSQGELFDDLMRLAVVDVETKEVIEYCVWGQDVTGSSPPIWTADSRQIIVESYPKVGEPARRRTILADIIADLAIQLGEGSTPIGWMTTAP